MCAGGESTGRIDSGPSDTVLAGPLTSTLFGIAVTSSQFKALSVLSESLVSGRVADGGGVEEEAFPVAGLEVGADDSPTVVTVAEVAEASGI